MKINIFDVIIIETSCIELGIICFTIISLVGIIYG